MEVESIIIIAVLVIGWFIVGIIVGKNIRKDQCDGTIFIEPTEDPNRDRVRFVLDLELDDIRKRKRLIFLVKNTDSKKSQSV